MARTYACILPMGILLMGYMPALAQTGSGQTGLEDIIVTATKTGQTQAQRTPIAMSVLSGDQLAASGASSVKDLASLVPNLSITAITVSPLIYIRGIGTNNVNNGSDPDVTVQVDGVYIARPFGQLSDFLDVARIEVLRGPQGTLYGRNAVGGTLNIISRKPSDTLTGALSLAGGNYDNIAAQAYVSGPIREGLLQASVAASYQNRDGYVNNVTAGAADLNDANRGSIRSQLRFTPSDAIEMITRADWTHADEHFDNYTHLLVPYAPAPVASSLIGNYSRAALNDANENKTTIWGISQEINVIMGDHFSFKSLTAYRKSRFHSRFDSDGTEARINIGVQEDNSRQFSQEMNLAVKYARFEGVAGLYYFDEHQDSLVEAILPPSAATAAATAVDSIALPAAHARSLAAFAQATYHPFDTVGITVGGRYTSDRKILDSYVQRMSLNPATPGRIPAGFPFTAHTARSYGAFTPKFGVDWQVAPNALAYASATKGFKSGGTNYAATNIAFLNYRPETIWSYEAGLKSEWWEKRLRINLSVFKYDYKDLQVLQPLAPGIVAINNAASAKVKGIEIETSAKPLPGLSLTANYTLLDAQFEAFPASAIVAGLVPYVIGNPRYSASTRTFDASGNRMNAAPKSTFSASAQYDHRLGSGSAFVRGDYYWQATASYDPSNAAILIEPAYSLINAAIGYRSAGERWNLQLQVRNLTDRDYSVGRSAAGGSPAGLAGPPRTITVQLTHKFPS